MNFKERVKSDLEQVFMNAEEFAEPHRIEGRVVDVVIDDDTLKERKQGQVIGIVEADMLIMGKKGDFPENLSPGRMLNVDVREMLIADSKEDMGLVEVALNQNRNR